MGKRWLPIRTTPEGSAKPQGDWDTGTDDLKSPLLAAEPDAFRDGIDDTLK